MNDNCTATVKINVVVYKPRPKKENGEDDGYDIVLVDSDSFVSELLSKDKDECLKETKKLLAKTKKNWQK